MRRPFRTIASLPTLCALLLSSQQTSLVEAVSLPEALQQPSRLLEEVQRSILERSNAIAIAFGTNRFRRRESAAQLVARDASPDADAEAMPQSYSAFSGAVYIVGANGQQLSGLSGASPAYCPNQAPQGCGNIGVYNWCCQAGTTCAWADAAQTYVGCCAAGQNCARGSLDRNAIQTVTVYITTTQYQQAPTAVVVAGGAQTTVYAQPGAVAGKTTATVQYAGFCTTVFAVGPNLPTTGAAQCGVALFVNESVRPVARRVLGSVVVFWMFLVGLAVMLRIRR